MEINNISNANLPIFCILRGEGLKEEEKKIQQRKYLLIKLFNAVTS